MFWLVSDAAREHWLRTLTIVVGLGFHIILLIKVPGFWRELGHAMGPGMAGAFIGFVFAAAAFVVAAGIGIAHFVRYLVYTLRSETKPEQAGRARGVWDSELDPS